MADRLPLNQRKTAQAMCGATLAPVADETSSRLPQSSTQIRQLALFHLSCPQILCAGQFRAHFFISLLLLETRVRQEVQFHLHQIAHTDKRLTIGRLLLRQVSSKFRLIFQDCRKTKWNDRNLPENRDNDIVKRQS